MGANMCCSALLFCSIRGTHLSHQAKSNTWQQTLAIHPSNNRGTGTQQSTSDFDANGNLLVLNNGQVNFFL
jgi:hypothetical protein